MRSSTGDFRLRHYGNRLYFRITLSTVRGTQFLGENAEENEILLARAVDVSSILTSPPKPVGFITIYAK